MESIAGGCQLGFGRREEIEEQSYSLYSWHCLAVHLCLWLCWAERCDGILLPFQNRLILFCFLYPSNMAQQIWFCTISFTCFQRFNLQFFENHCICHGGIKHIVCISNTIEHWTLGPFLAVAVSSHDQKVLDNFSQNPQQWCSLTTLRLLSTSALRVVSLTECLFGKSAWITRSVNLHRDTVHTAPFTISKVAWNPPEALNRVIRHC